MTSFSTGLTAVLLLSSMGCAGPPLASPRLSIRPNFVVVRDGVYFREATVSVSQCHPVRASLLTGLPAHRHGVYSVQFQAPGVAETLARPGGRVGWKARGARGLRRVVGRGE